MKKYLCNSKTNESVSSMSSDSMASKLTVLKAHAFSKANSGCIDTNSVTRNKVHSTNTHPICSSALFAGERSQNEEQSYGKVKELISLYNRASSTKLQYTGSCSRETETAKFLPSNCGLSSNINSGQKSDEHIQREGDLRPPFLAAKAGGLEEETHVKNNFPGSRGLNFKISETPKVVITPATDMEEEIEEDSSKPVETNGEVVPRLLNERSTSESDSLSSASSSVDEFFTDEEATDEELNSSCTQEKPCKVRNYPYYYSSLMYVLLY